jgi:hypothetical protein
MNWRSTPPRREVTLDRAVERDRRRTAGCVSSPSTCLRRASAGKRDRVGGRRDLADVTCFLHCSRSMMAKSCFFQPMLRTAVRNSLVVAVVGNGMCSRRPISERGRAEDLAHRIRVTLEKSGLQKEPLGVDIIVVTKGGYAVITRFPAEELLLAGSHCVMVNDPLATARKTEATPHSASGPDGGGQSPESACSSRGLNSPSFWSLPLDIKRSAFRARAAWHRNPA